MEDEKENVMPVKTCTELEKLTFAGFWLRERAKSASASTAGGRSCCEPRNGGSLDKNDADQAGGWHRNIRAFEMTGKEAEEQSL
jgi:hypothetical protein